MELENFTGNGNRMGNLSPEMETKQETEMELENYNRKRKWNRKWSPLAMTSVLPTTDAENNVFSRLSIYPQAGVVGRAIFRKKW